VIAYGEHVRRFVAQIRGRDADIFVAPQSVEPELFGRTVTPTEIDAFRREHGLGDSSLVLYAGRLVPEKGVDVLLAAWPQVATATGATLVLIGEGPLAPLARTTTGAHLIDALARERLPVAYAASAFATLPSVPTPRFLEPWGLVCNEAMHQGKPALVTTAVGAAAGGLVVDGETGVVVAPNNPDALATAATRLLEDDQLRQRLGANAKQAVAAYNYDAMESAFAAALATAIKPSPTGP
jgi:glycosyltransferase involved in cell wall biosynthesis